MAVVGRVDRAIRGKVDQQRRGREIAALAARQHGVVARRQLLVIDISADAIDRRSPRVTSTCSIEVSTPSAIGA
jgi:hypothetical protein